MHLGHAEAEQARAVHLQVALGVGAVGEEVDPAGLAGVAVLGPDLPQQAGLLRDGLRQALHGLRHVLAPGALVREIDLKKDGHGELLGVGAGGKGGSGCGGTTQHAFAEACGGSRLVGHSTVSTRTFGHDADRSAAFAPAGPPTPRVGVAAVRFCRSAGRRECGRSEAKLSTNARYP